ncbi:DinB family protein [Chitinophaga qingshengii]|uniref:DinB family protein n=1 Tax=Chitinophaga qingshengii TaxID=1569794 RepID=A0ABR7TX76_9BACT|nr:DinB family protein [Chitinophaga qingshengii]MBC9935061.1 DinB family protein [Chitinophaga qingshengii]
MEIIQALLKEMDQEAATTRKMLSRVPEDKYDWQPHPKSMKMLRLATHIAELPGWVTMAIHTDGLDFQANPYKPVVLKNAAELMEYFETTLADGRKNLEAVSLSRLDEPWTLSDGDQVLVKQTVGEMIRVAYSQIVHHRAQLGVYLRLLDIPIPGSYGPSADEY